MKGIEQNFCINFFSLNAYNSRKNKNVERNKIFSNRKNLDTSELQRLAESIKAEIEYENDKLIKALRRKLNYQNKQQSNCDIITAVLQALFHTKSYNFQDLF